MSQFHDVIVLGGGVAGLTAASILSDTYPNVLLLEGFGQLGGLHRSLNVNGFTFDIGSFFFYPNSILFARHPGLLETTIPAPCRHERIRPDGTICTYPFAPEELQELSNWEKAVFGISLLKGRLAFGADENLERACHRMLGRAFYEHSGLSNYVARFYGPDLPGSHISPIFVDKRLQFLKQRTRPNAVLSTIWKGLCTYSSRRRTRPSKQSIMGRVRAEAGFPEMYAPVAEDLVKKGVAIELNKPLQLIRKKYSGFELITDDINIYTNNIVSTLPIEILLKYIGKPGKCNIASSSLLTLCVSFSGTRGFKSGVLFNFHKSGRWKRLTMHSDFYGRRNNREYFSVEVPASECHSMNGEEGFADFRSSVRAHDLFLGDLRLEEAVLTPFAYPRYELGYEEALTDAFGRIADFGIVTAGRQGRFDYLPTSGPVAKQVAEILEPMLST